MRYPGLLLVVVILLAGCGYTMVNKSVLPFRSITVESVQNRTFEPGLQDTFIRVFTEEALSRGLKVDKQGDVRLSVIFTRYSLQTVSIRNDLSAEYRVRIKADITAEGPGERRWEKKGFESEFLETFSASGSIEEVQAKREIANEKALRDLSRRLLILITYGEAGS